MEDLENLGVYKRISALKDLYLRNRGSGHTTLLTDGLCNYRYHKAFIVPSKSFAKSVLSQSDYIQTQIISYNDLAETAHNVSGTTALAMDNGAILNLLKDVESAISYYRHQYEVMKSENEIYKRQHDKSKTLHER